MSLITEKIKNNKGKITFGNLSVGDEIHKYIFDKDYQYKIVGTIYKISKEKLDNDEYLSIYYTYNGVIKSKISAYPNDYCIIDNLDTPTFTIYSPNDMSEIELNNCLENKSSISFLNYEPRIK